MSHSNWSGCCCLQCIPEKEVGIVEDLGACSISGCASRGVVDGGRRFETPAPPPLPLPLRLFGCKPSLVLLLRNLRVQSCLALIVEYIY